MVSGHFGPEADVYIHFGPLSLRLTYAWSVVVLLLRPYGRKITPTLYRRFYLELELDSTLV